MLNTLLAIPLGIFSSNNFQFNWQRVLLLLLSSLIGVILGINLLNKMNIKIIKNNYLPLGLTDGAILKKEIKKDQYIKLDDVEINWKEEVLTARKYQNKLIKY